MRLCLLRIPLSGSDVYLLSELRRIVDVDVVDVPFPPWTNFLLKMRTAHPDLSAWKERHSAAMDIAFKSYKVFDERTRLAARGIRRLPNRPDAILQISGLYSPGVDDIPYATYNDFTTALAAREYPPWAPFADPFAERQWYERESRLYQNASHIFALSDHTRASIISDYGVSPQSVTTVGAGLNFTSMPDRDTGYDNRTVIFVGLDFKRKGGLQLLEAWEAVRGQVPDARLVIVGPRMDRTPPGVECVGHLASRDHLIELYRQSSLFVMPSICEPFGSVFLEAMACKLPCVGTTTDAMPEIIEDGRTGFLVPPGDSNALADTIVGALKSERLPEMGELARERVRQSFMWRGIADMIVAGIRNLLTS